jgi:hypothetical protein
MRFGEGLRAGVQLDYLNVQLGDDYGSSNTWSPRSACRRGSPMRCGSCAPVQPTQTELGGPYAEKVPTVMRAGLDYTFSDKLLMTGAVEKDIDKPETFRGGSNTIRRTHCSSAGRSTGPVQGHFGSGCASARWTWTWP